MRPAARRGFRAANFLRSGEVGAMLAAMTLPSNFRAMLERLAFVIYLMLLVASIGVSVLGWVVGHETGNFDAMWLALGGLGLSAWLHVHGHAHWHFRECERSFDVLDSPGVFPRADHEEAGAAELAELLARFEAEADVWQRGEIRREIVAQLAAMPALREEFSGQLAAHPDL